MKKIIYFKGDIISCIHDLKTFLDPKYIITNEIVGQISNLIIRFKKEAIPVEYSEKLLKTIGDIIEKDPTDKTFMLFVTNLNFLQVLSSVIFEYAQKLVPNKEFEAMKLSSFSTHLCYEYALFIWIGFVDNAKIMEALMNCLQKFDIIEQFIQVIDQCMCYDYLYLTQEVLLDICCRLCHYFESDSGIFNSLVGKITHHQEIRQAMYQPDAILELLQDMRPLLNRINGNTIGSRIKSFEITGCLFHASSTAADSIKLQQQIEDGMKSSSSSVVSIIPLPYLQRDGWLDLCGDMLCCNLMDLNFVIRCPYTNILSVQEIKYSPQSPLSSNINSQSHKYLQVNLLQPPDNLLDVLARHNIPSSLRDRACYACALIFELMNNNNEELLKIFNQQLQRNPMETSVLRKSSVVSSREQTPITALSSSAVAIAGQDHTTAICPVSAVTGTTQFKIHNITSGRTEPEPANSSNDPVDIVPAVEETTVLSSISSADKFHIDTQKDVRTRSSKPAPDSLVLLAQKFDAKNTLKKPAVIEKRINKSVISNQKKLSDAPNTSNFTSSSLQQRGSSHTITSAAMKTIRTSSVAKNTSSTSKKKIVSSINAATTTVLKANHRTKVDTEKPVLVAVTTTDEREEYYQNEGNNNGDYDNNNNSNSYQDYDTAGYDPIEAYDTTQHTTNYFANEPQLQYNNSKALVVTKSGGTSAKITSIKESKGKSISDPPHIQEEEEESNKENYMVPVNHRNDSTVNKVSNKMNVVALSSSTKPSTISKTTVLSTIRPVVTAARMRTPHKSSTSSSPHSSSIQQPSHTALDKQQQQQPSILNKRKYGNPCNNKSIKSTFVPKALFNKEEPVADIKYGTSNKKTRGTDYSNVEVEIGDISSSSSSSNARNMIIAKNKIPSAQQQQQQPPKILPVAFTARNSKAKTMKEPTLQIIAKKNQTTNKNTATKTKDDKTDRDAIKLTTTNTTSYKDKQLINQQQIENNSTMVNQPNYNPEETVADPEYASAAAASAILYSPDLNQNRIPFVTTVGNNNSNWRNNSTNSNINKLPNISKSIATNTTCGLHSGTISNFLSTHLQTAKSEVALVPQLLLPETAGRDWSFTESIVVADQSLIGVEGGVMWSSQQQQQQQHMTSQETTYSSEQEQQFTTSHHPVVPLITTTTMAFNDHTSISRSINAKNKKSIKASTISTKLMKKRKQADSDNNSSSNGECEEIESVQYGDSNASADSSNEEQSLISGLLAEIMNMQKERNARKKVKLLSNIAKSADLQISSYLDQWKSFVSHHCTEIERNINDKLEYLCTSADKLCESMHKDSEQCELQDHQAGTNLRVIEQDIKSLQNEIQSAVATYKTEDIQVRNQVLLLQSNLIASTKKTVSMLRGDRKHSHHHHDQKLLDALKEM